MGGMKTSRRPELEYALKMFLGAASGGLVGALVGFVGALIIAAPRTDGTFGMREIVIGVPTLAFAGLLLGAYLARTH